MNSDIAPEPDDYYEAISDDECLGGVEEEHENGVNGVCQEKDASFSLDFETLPFVPKFSSEIRNTVEAAAVSDNVSADGGVFVGNWGQESYVASETQMECPYFPSEHGTVTMPEKGHGTKDSVESQNTIEFVQQGGLAPSLSLAHILPFKANNTSTSLNENQFVVSDLHSHSEDIGLSGESSLSEGKEMHQSKSLERIVQDTDTQSAQCSVIGSNKIEESANWLDENGDPIQGAFDQINPEVKGDPCVSMVNNTRVEYVFHVKEKTAVAIHVESASAESVNSQGSEACFGNVASSSNLSIEDSNTGAEISVRHGENDEYDQKKLYEASKNKEQYNMAVLAASSSASNEEKKIEDSETKPKERFNRFKRNRFLDQTTAQETEATTQPVKSEAEIALESQALTEILREVKQGAERAKEYGALGWQKCPVPVVNKTFLRNTLVSTLREPYRPPRKRGQRHVGLEGRKPYDGDSHSRSSSQSSRSDSRSHSSSGSRSRSRSRSSRDSRSRSRSHDSKRRKGHNRRGHWPRGGPQNMYYDWQAMEAYMAQYGYPWYGHEAYGMYYEEGWPMDMYYGDPRAWAQYQSYYRGFPPRGRGPRGRGRGFYGNRWAEEEEVVYSEDEDFSSSSLSPSPSPDKDGPDESSTMSSKRPSQRESKGSQVKPGIKDSGGSKVKKGKKSKGVDGGSDEESEPGGKQRKKKKKKKKKKKHKKIKKDETENTASKKGEGEKDSSHEDKTSKDPVIKSNSEDPKAKEESQESTKTKKKKVVKKKAKISQDLNIDASVTTLKKKKKSVPSRTADKTEADGQGKGKGKGKSKVKKKMSQRKRTECVSKGELSAMDKNGQESHVNIKGEEGSAMEGNDDNGSLSENRKKLTEADEDENSKVSAVGSQTEKPTLSTSSLNDSDQLVADRAKNDQGIESSISVKGQISSHEYNESHKEEQGTKTIPDSQKVENIINPMDRGIEPSTIMEERNMNESKIGSGGDSRVIEKNSQEQKNAREIDSNDKRQNCHDEGHPKSFQDGNTKNVQVNKRDRNELEQDRDEQIGKKVRKTEKRSGQTEEHNRHSDSKAGIEKNEPSSDLMVEGKKKEKKRKRELESDAQSYHHSKRKRGDHEHDRDKGPKGKLRDISSEKMDETKEQKIVTRGGGERKSTKEKLADRGKDVGKTYAIKSQSDGNNTKIDSDKGKIDAWKSGKNEDKGKEDTGKSKKGGDKLKKNADKRKKDGGKGKAEVEYRKMVTDKGKSDAYNEKTNRRDSIPVLFDAREKIKEKRRKRELERQREMESLVSVGNVKTSERENLRCLLREDNENDRHQQSGKDRSCNDPFASSRRSPTKWEKREKTSECERAHIQDQLEIEQEGCKDNSNKSESHSIESKSGCGQEGKG